ncbi:MAG: hypothetical protein SCH70_12980, partial [Candidatus Methanoperedens sp.]|nr:hypothetical protein [Candidatus Methanoperedens sp.]
MRTALTIIPMIAQKANIAPRLSTLYFHSKSKGTDGMHECSVKQSMYPSTSFYFCWDHFPDL